jgi:hypothetical protein
MYRNWRWALLLLSVGIQGCAHRDDFPMRNPANGQEVLCQSGEYWFDEGMPQMRVAEQCIRACERYGFRRFTGNPYADAPHPQNPDKDIMPFVPPACLP